LDVYTLSLHDALPICVAPAGLDVIKVPKNISNYVLGVFVFMAAGSFLAVILGYKLADKVARIQMPSMTFKARIIAGRIKRELKPDRKSTRLNSSHVSI